MSFPASILCGGSVKQREDACRCRHGCAFMQCCRQTHAPYPRRRVLLPNDLLHQDITLEHLQRLISLITWLAIHLLLQSSVLEQAPAPPQCLCCIIEPSCLYVRLAQTDPRCRLNSDQTRLSTTLSAHQYIEQTVLLGYFYGLLIARCGILRVILGKVERAESLE